MLSSQYSLKGLSFVPLIQTTCSSILFCLIWLLSENKLQREIQKHEQMDYRSYFPIYSTTCGLHVWRIGNFLFCELFLLLLHLVPWCSTWITYCWQNQIWRNGWTWRIRKWGWWCYQVLISHHFPIWNSKLSYADLFYYFRHIAGSYDISLTLVYTNLF